MSVILIAGVPALAWVCGRWLLDRSFGRRLPDRWLASTILSLTVGVALLTPILSILAIFGLFRAPLLGAAGWVVAAAVFLQTRFAAIPRRGFDTADAVALAVVAGFVIVAMLGRDDTLGAGRDQQVYAEFAVALSERGQASATYSSLDEADRELLAHSEIFDVPGAEHYRNGMDRPITPQFPLGWTVWLALAHAAMGTSGLFGANALVFAIGALVFFLLARQIATPILAAAATVALCTLPSSLWIAGISLSEPLAMALLLAIPLVAFADPERARWPCAVLLFGSALVRIDALLALPAMLLAVVLVRSAAPTGTHSDQTRQFAIAQLGAGLAAALFLYAFHRPYFLDNIGYLRLIAAAAIGLAVVALTFPSRSLRTFGQIVAYRGTTWLMVAILVSLLVYSVAIRPSLEPFSVIPPGTGLEGTRDFREDSVLGLASYLSWPLLVSGAAGVCFALMAGWAARPSLPRPLVLALGMVPTLLYLWSPHVSPDHPWAIRRFVPQAIPFVVLLATVFSAGLARRFGRLGTVGGVVLLVLPPALLVAGLPADVRLLRENYGTSGELAAIASELPDGLVVSVGPHENFATVLLVAFGKPVAITNNVFRNSDKGETLARWVEAKMRLGRPAWLLYGPDLPRTGLLLETVRDWRVTRKFIAPTTRAPATSAAHSETRLFIARALGLDHGFGARMFGGEWAWGAHDEGFFESEVAPFGMFRYTRGYARILLPAAPLRTAAALKIDLFTFAEPGKTRAAQVSIDNQAIWSGDLAGGVTTLVIPVGNAFRDDVANFELRSETVDPGSIGIADSRSAIGVGLIGVRPLATESMAAQMPGVEGFHARLAAHSLPSEPLRVLPGKECSFVLDVENAGSAWWPTVRELGGPLGAVQIALRWHRRGTPADFVGDNRWPMSVSLLAGDRTRMQVPLAAVGLNGAPLAPGDYEVRVFLVREGHGVFSDDHTGVVRIPVTIT